MSKDLEIEHPWYKNPTFGVCVSDRPLSLYRGF